MGCGEQDGGLKTSSCPTRPGLSPRPLRPPQLGQEGKVPLRSAYLYYNVTEKVRHMMESYFRLEVPLHFSYSHLVCRTAIDGERGLGEHNSGRSGLLRPLVLCPLQQLGWSGLGLFLGDLAAP